MEPVAASSFPTIRNFGNRMRVLVTIAVAAVLYAIAWAVAGLIAGLLFALWALLEGGDLEGAAIVLVLALVLGPPIGLIIGLTRVPTRRRALDDLVRRETSPWGSPSCPWFEGEPGVGRRLDARAEDHEAGTLREATNLVSGLALAAGIPSPQVVFVHVDAPNAFVLGSRPSNSVVGVTRGLFTSLSRAQAEAIIAWQITRIMSRDAALTTWATAFIADGISALDGVVDGTSDALDGTAEGDLGPATPDPQAVTARQSRSSGGVPFGARRTLAAYEAMVLRGLAKRRDRAAITITRNPRALLEAFEIIAADPQEIPCVSRATTSLWLEVVPTAYSASTRDQELARSLALAPRIAGLRAALGMPPGLVTEGP